MKKEEVENIEEIQEEEVVEVEEKLLTQEEVNRLIAQSKSKAKEEAKKELEAKYQEQLQSEVEEAKRLAKMNEDEQQEHQLKKLQEELEALKKKEAQYGLAKEASKMMAEKGIVADDALLKVLVTEEAETTHDAVKNFLSLFEAKVQEGVKVALSGTPPKANTKRDQVENPWSKDTFNLTKQGELLKSNPALAAQLRAAAK